MSKRRRAFTLIELLVVVAIIALLISILLPSLSAAREQAKVAKCTANLKSIMTASYSYFGDQKDTFPFFAKAAGTAANPINGVSSWTYAGKFVSQYWQAWQGGMVYFTSKEKPLNPYLIGQIPEDNAEILSAKCPSDVWTYQRGTFAPGDVADESVSTYDDVGVSYQFNLTGIDTDHSSATVTPWRNYGQGWQQNLLIILRGQTGNFNSTFVWAWDGSFDYAVNAPQRIIGDHKQFDRFSFAFLDGHAAYMSADALKMCGPGWTVLFPKWIWRVGQPRPVPLNYALTNTSRCN
ncbi:MAG: prepilin-type N-terminal cleavage/methylation domain-containing protein [Phycisphaerae bacterium]